MTRILITCVGIALFALWVRQLSSGWPLLPPSNVIGWTTQSEDNVYGYDVYRGTGEDGPFLVINPDSVLGTGTSDLPESYSFTDSNIAANTVYWYYVESISLSGERKRLTPVYPSRPKANSLW